MSRSKPLRDRSMFLPVEPDEFSGRVIAGMSIGNDFVNGNRGMARAVRGAKKFLNSRRRFHERMTLQSHFEEDDSE